MYSEILTEFDPNYRRFEGVRMVSDASPSASVRIGPTPPPCGRPSWTAPNRYVAAHPIFNPFRLIHCRPIPW